MKMLAPLLFLLLVGCDQQAAVDECAAEPPFFGPYELTEHWYLRIQTVPPHGHASWAVAVDVDGTTFSESGPNTPVSWSLDGQEVEALAANLGGSDLEVVLWNFHARDYRLRGCDPELHQPSGTIVDSSTIAPGDTVTVAGRR